MGYFMNLQCLTPSFRRVLQILLPNGEVSDGWPRRDSRIGKTVLGQPFAPPKSWATFVNRRPVRANIGALEEAYDG